MLSLENSIKNGSSARATRWMVVGVILFAGFGILDVYYLPLHFGLALTIRLAAAVPLLILCVVVMLSRAGKSYHQLLIVIFTTVAVLALDGIIAVSSSDEKAFHFYYVGLILVILWTNSSGLRLRTALWLQIGILCSYNLVAGVFLVPDISAVELIGNNVLIATAIFISLFSAHVIQTFVSKDQRRQEELNREHAIKDKLLSIIAHDVRGPLSTIKGLLTGISEGFVTYGEMTAHSKKLIDSVDSIMAFLDMLFVWSIEQTEGLLLQKKDINLHQVVAGIFSQYSTSANRKDIGLKNEIDYSLVLHADSTIVQLVLQNLIWSAIKCTSAGWIVIKSKQSTVTTEVVIESAGFKIEKHVLETVLNETNIASLTGTHNEKGVGMVFSICKEFIAKQGGLFSILYLNESGIVISFTLPNKDAVWISREDTRMQA